MSASIFTRSYLALLVAQFLGAANDNLLKQMVVLQVANGIWKDELGAGGQGWVTVVFTLPFILFSGWSGEICDKNSKQTVARWMKAAEVPIALGALATLYTRNLYVGMFVVLLLALQSTIFGPAKYGMIPEMLPKEALGRANGVINMLTNVAIIGGVVLGGMLSEKFNADPQGFALVPGLIMLGVAAAGLVAAWCLQPLPVSDPNLKYSTNPVGPYWHVLKHMARDRVLLFLCIGGAFFYFVAVIAAMEAIPDFKHLLAVNDEQLAYLSAPLAVGIGVGSVMAGWLFKNSARNLKSVPLGAVGMTACILALALSDLWVDSLSGVIGAQAGQAAALGLETHAWPTGMGESKYQFAMVAFGLIGTFGGFYIIPFQSMIQTRAPDAVIGRVIGTYNFTNFVFIAAAGGLYAILRNESLLALSVQQVLLLVAGLFAVGSVALLWMLRAQLTGIHEEEALWDD